jgi:hypothetical protein
MFEIGDNLKSRVNTFFDGYYTVVNVSKTHYALKPYERNGKPSFADDKYGNYKKTIKWVEKNMYKISPHPPEIQEDENDFTSILDWDF